MLAVTPTAYRPISAPEAPVSNTPAHIIATVARRHDLSARDLCSPSTRRHVVAARVAAMRAVWTAHPRLSYRDVCRFFGRNDCELLERSIQRKPLRDLGLMPGETMGLSRDIVRIIGQIAAIHGTTARAILGRARPRYIIKARFAAIYAVHQAKPHLSLPQLGRIFGGRDHTTILNALKRAEGIGALNPPVLPNAEASR